MVVIRMPGGDLEYVAPSEFQWMREAFEHEWSGTVMLRVAAGNRIYAIEGLNSLRQKFSDAAVGLADFTAPEGDRVAVVNAASVREVEPANAALHHELARAVLKFGTRLSLAVRQTVDESRALLVAAGGTPGMETLNARRRGRSSGPRRSGVKGRTAKRKRTA